MFLIRLVYYQLMAIMAVYAIDNLQASPSEAGLIAGIFILAALVSRIFSDKFIELVRRKKRLYIGLAVYLLVTLFYFGARNLQLLFMIIILHGLGYGMATTAAMTIFASILQHSFSKWCKLI